MPIQRTAEKVTLQHPEGASCEILFYGATVISWISPSGTPGSPTLSPPAERLFVSSSASLDGSKPVRGGIPICWPIFGAPSPTHPEHAALKQHGFARSSVWSWGGEVMDGPEGVSIRLVLEPDEGIKAVYAAPFKLTYTVTLAAHQLTTSLRVLNPPGGKGQVEFQALLHNYFRGDASVAQVEPLKGVTYTDKVKDGAVEVETREVVDVRECTDRVYESAGGLYTLAFPPTSVLEIKTLNLPDVTVWNPQAVVGAKMADMEPGGWERYVCVEPGYVREFVKLGEGEEWFGQQVISAL